MDLRPVPSLSLLHDTNPSPVITEKGKETADTETPNMANLSINATGAPPRPSASSKPSGTPPPQPPRPALQRQETEEDDDDPFGDKNVVETPAFERGEPRW